MYVSRQLSFDNVLSLSMQTMSWYYITGGLILWVVDHMLRLKRSIGHAVEVCSLDITGAGNVVRLGYTVSKQRSILNGTAAQPVC